MFKSNGLSTDEKMQLLEKVLADDKSDIARDVRAQCMTSIADPAVKEQAWKDITDPKSPISNKLKEAKM